MGLHIVLCVVQSCIIIRMRDNNLGWAYFAEKKANWLTDTFIVSPLTALYKKQNAEFKEEQAAKNKPAQSAMNAGRRDALIGLAQSVSDSYRPGSLARPKTYHGGRAVAR